MKLNDEDLLRVRQIRCDALAAKYIYKSKLHNYRKFEQFGTVITYLLPIIFLTAQYITKDTEFENTINLIVTIGSVIVLLYGLLSIIFKINDTIQTLNKNLENNISLAEYCLSIIAKEKGIPVFFSELVTKQNQIDASFLTEIKKTKQQESYRNALKEVEPGKITHCLQCGSNPYNFKPGNCQLCGGEINEQNRII